MQVVKFKTKEQQQYTAPQPTTDKQHIAACWPTYITQDDDNDVLPPKAMRT
jgi:hypothetical protein